MSKPLRFHPLVAEDIRAAASWYEDISSQLGNQFRAAVDARLNSIEFNSESYGMIRPMLRAARIAKFPYIIVFHCTQDETEIVGVFHSASNPEKWQKRNA